MPAFIDFVNQFVIFIADLYSEYYSFLILTGVGIFFIIGIFIFISVRQRVNLYKRAVRNYNRGRKQRALLLLAIEVGKNPTNRRAILLRADIENELGLHSLAEKDYKKLLALKIPGDEINPLEIKKRLLESLFEQKKQLEVFMLAEEILSEKRLDTDALYYLGAVYTEQMKFADAEKILRYVVENRPGMARAFFMLSLVELQMGFYSKAIEHIKKAQLKLRSTEDNPDYYLVETSLHFFQKNYSEALKLLDMLKARNPYPLISKKNLFLMRLEGFCNYFLGNLDRAAHVLNRIYRKLSGYGTGGRKPAGISSYPGRVYSVDGRKSVFRKDNYLNEYFRLKEVLTDSGLYLNPDSASIFSGTGLLGVEGLTYTTWAALDYAFCLVKKRNYKEAAKFLTAVKDDHPEVIGLRNLVELIVEKAEEKEEFLESGGKGEDIPRKISERVIRRAGRRYDLWEYLEEWEKNAIRPFHVFALMGLVPKRQLNPILLFRVMGKLRSEIERRM